MAVRYPGLLLRVFYSPQNLNGKGMFYARNQSVEPPPGGYQEVQWLHFPSVRRWWTGLITHSELVLMQGPVCGQSGQPATADAGQW